MSSIGSSGTHDFHTCSVGVLRSYNFTCDKVERGIYCSTDQCRTSAAQCAPAGHFLPFRRIFSGGGAAAAAACTQSPPSHKDLCNMRGHFDSLLGTPFLPSSRERGAFLQLAALKMRTHSRPLAPTSWTFVRTCPDQRARHHLRDV